ncbi:hypothetical protein PALB_18560 [Pseudoalteromonas luteoviolacea B = ATCC 29581]|nr:hypothetical protein PALB_18560 [Pseudoalteromonas luteoviolacea B = ATCC 29581]
MNVLMIGASSAIAKATISHLKRTNPSVNNIVTVSRDAKHESECPSSSHFQCDYSQTAIRFVVNALQNDKAQFDHVLFFNGVLHTKSYAPEKRVSQFDVAYFDQLLQANVITHVLWFEHLAALLKRNKESKVVILSARIGSISDNRSGGWYSYRMSKAALNMAAKCFSIELARTHPLSKMYLFHPGTTDTPLSKPFQRNVPKEKLFTPEFVASSLCDLLNKPTVDNVIEYLDWQHSPIEW